MATAARNTPPAGDALWEAMQAQPASWAVATAVFAMLGFSLTSPTACSEVQACEAMHDSFPSTFNACAALGLTFVLLNEGISLVSTYKGVREAKALVPDIRSRCLPSLLLTIMFAVLVAQHTIIATSPTAWFASVRLGAASPGGEPRPVYTLTYVEWLMIVPLLLTVSGHCAMGRPLEELARPIVVTNFYIVLSWMAMLTTSSALRWSLVCSTFVLYGWASYDMFLWVVEYERAASPELPSRRLRPCLSIGLVLLFSVYGVVYMGSLTGMFSPWTERLCHLFLDVGSKIAMGIAFVVIRANEYHRTLTSVLKRVSTSNVALISILRGSFDYMLPCTADERGACKLPEKSAADMLRLESDLGRPIMGMEISELLTEEQEKESFFAYVRNTLRQAESHESFSSVTLSTQGEWNVDKPGQAPPVAQVLNCRMACGGGRPSVRCAVHLSVVPQTALAVGKMAWQMVAAVRFEQDHMATVPEESAVTAADHFDTFDAERAMAEEGKDGIVASLNDIARLGISNILKSVRGDSVAGDETESQGQRSVPSTLASIIGAQKMVSSTRPSMQEGMEASMENTMKLALRGSWSGKVHESLGGYEQTFRFLEDGRQVQVSLLGKTLTGQYQLNCAQMPFHMDLQVMCDDGAAPPAIPYIFNITQDGTLCICGPTDDDMSRPLKFVGPGMCMLEKVADGSTLSSKSKLESVGDTSSTSTRSGKQERVVHSGASSTAASTVGWGERSYSQAPEPTKVKPAPAPPTVSKPAGAPEVSEVLGQCRDSMAMMQMMTAAQFGIAATSVAVLGASMLRRRA